MEDDTVSIFTVFLNVLPYLISETSRQCSRM